MAGIYIHIPFCKQACTYCDFHFSTSLRTKADFLKALSIEIDMRKDFLEGDDLHSIYFGGGTPSLLDANEIEVIINQLNNIYNFSSDIEITLEANPDDITFDKFNIFKSYGINRLSLGVQSFYDVDLKYMNRAHDHKMAKKSLEILNKIGYDTISADLIFGSPTTTDEMLSANIETLIKESIVNHISAYALTVESGTPLKALIDKGMSLNVDEETQSRQFDIVHNHLTKAGYDHYEISNYARNGNFAVHNTNYWKGVPYLGLGPSAHSFDGDNRYFNVANNIKYIKSLDSKVLPISKEILTPENKFNEYILTSLRTKWGISLQFIKANFPTFNDEFIRNITNIENINWYEMSNEHIKLTHSGKHFADQAAMNLFA